MISRWTYLVTPLQGILLVLPHHGKVADKLPYAAVPNRLGQSLRLGPRKRTAVGELAHLVQAFAVPSYSSRALLNS
jgi:hypothetical protein